MISEISGSHNGVYGNDYLLGGYAVYSRKNLSTYQRCLLPPSVNFYNNTQYSQ